MRQVKAQDVHAGDEIIHNSHKFLVHVVGRREGPNGDNLVYLKSVHSTNCLKGTFIPQDPHLELRVDPKSVLHIS